MESLAAEKERGTPRSSTATHRSGKSFSWRKLFRDLLLAVGTAAVLALLFKGIVSAGIARFLLERDIPIDENLFSKLMQLDKYNLATDGVNATQMFR